MRCHSSDEWHLLSFFSKRHAWSYVDIYVTAAAGPVPDGRDYRQTEPPTHYHTPQPVVETLDEVLQAVAEATQACAAGELNKSNSTITLSDDSVEVLTSDEPAAANDDVEVVVLDETTDKWNVTALMAFTPP